ncbi:MAG: hypothetical protein N2689_02155 [Verrucomicrobiae bacterium]|nr:hypothetical protein [Verrucomicrobiae bacterium]
MGATLYHMVCCRPPFDGDDPAKVMAMQITHPPEPPHRLNPNISREFEAIILKLLAKDPNDRFQSPAELVEAIERLRTPAPVAQPTAPMPAPRPTAAVPVAALASSPWRLLGRWIGRGALSLIGLAAVALAGVFVFRPDWVRGKVADLLGLAPPAAQATNIVASAAQPEPLPVGPKRETLDTPTPTDKTAETPAAPAAPATPAAPPSEEPPAKTQTTAAPSPEDLEKLLESAEAMAKTNNFVEAEAVLQKALDQCGDAPKLRARIETAWQTIQTDHIAYEKKRAEEAAAKAASDKARREQIEADARALVAQIEPWVRAFYLEHALQQLCAMLAKTSDADLRAALQDKVTELQLLCDLKKQLIAAIKKGRLQARALPLTSGSMIEGRPAAADADGLSVAVGTGSGTIELPWNRFAEPAIYAMLQEAFATGSGTTMAAMALYAWETGRAEDAKRYFDLAKSALGDKLPTALKRRAEQG